VAGRKKEQPGGLPDGLVVGLIALLLGVTLLVWTATGIAGLLSHGGWPSDVHFTRTPRAMRALAQQPHDVAAAWPGAAPGELPGSGLFWGVFVGQFMVLAVIAVWALNAVSRLRSRGLRKPAPPVLEEVPGAAVPRPRGLGGLGKLPPARRARRDPYGAPDPQGGHGAPPPDGAKEDTESLDAWFRTVPRATPFAAGDTPTTQLPPTPTGEEPAAAAGRGEPHLAALADGEVTRTYALFADPRGDKGKRIVQPAVLAAAGPVVVTLADPETYHQTVGNRAKLGPVHVYDPAHVLDVPGRLRWAPHSGCQEPGAARIRSAALLAALRTDRADEAIVHDTAATLLRCWLHAAAVGGLPFRQIQRWAAGGAAAGEPVRILRTDTGAASGWSGELESVLHAHPERRDAAQGLIRRITEPLNSVHIRDACSPGRTGGLDLESFTAERGTLYVVGERVEDPRTRPGAMPLLTALVSSVVEHGRGMAAGSPSGRLDPPMTFVLDDVAALAPLPGLPALLTEGHPSGLPTLAVLRSPEQALARWGTPVWSHADMRLALGEDPPTVPDAVRLH
jgi:hypothetical protein